MQKSCGCQGRSRHDRSIAGRILSRVVAALITALLTAAIARADYVDWNPSFALPSPRGGGEAVRLNAHVFLVGGLKAHANESAASAVTATAGSVTPATDVIVTNVNYFFSWNAVPGISLPGRIVGKGFVEAVLRSGPIWETPRHPIYVCYACGDSESDVSSVVAVIWADISSESSASGSLSVHTANIPRRMATLAQCTTIKLPSDDAETTLFIFGGLDVDGEFVSVPEKHVAPTSNASDESHFRWDVMQSHQARMPLPWCSCDSTEANGAIYLTACLKCATQQPVAGVLIFFCATQTWNADVPPSAGQPTPAASGGPGANYSRYWPAVGGAVGSGLIHQFIATYVQQQTSVANTAQIILYDVVHGQQNLITTVAIQAVRTRPFVIVVGVLLFAFGGFLLPAAPGAPTPLTAFADVVQLYPRVNGDLNNRNRQYAVGEDIKLYTGSTCAEPASLIRLATNSDCLTVVPGTSDAPCANPNVISTASISVDPGCSLATYLCQSWGTCLIPPAQRTLCGGNYTEDDCRWAYCCWDNVRRQCYSFGAVQPGVTDTQSVFFAPVTISLSMLPLASVKIAREPPLPPVAHWFASPFFIGAAAVVVSLAAYFIAAALFRRRRHRENRGDPSNVFVAFGKKYSIIRQVGQGSFGTVFLAERSPDRLKVALKCIPYQTSRQRDVAIAEYDTISKLSHRNLVRVYDLVLNWDVRGNSKPLRQNRGRDRTSDSNERLGSAKVASSGHSSGGQTPATVAAHGASSGTPVETHSAEGSSQMQSLGDSLLLRNGSATSTPAAAYGSVSPASTSLNSSGHTISRARAAYNDFTALASFVCLVMEYFPRGSLRQWIARRAAEAPIPPRSVVSIVRQVCALLAYLHGQRPPVTHRDLTFDNVLMDGDRVVVTDFGLAQTMLADHTHMSTCAGTVYAAAPETLRGNYTPAVDIFAVGCMLYGLCTRRVLPGNARVMFSDILDEGFADEVRDELRGYPAALAELTLQMLAYEPSARPTAEAARRRLDELHEELATDAMQSS